MRTRLVVLWVASLVLCLAAKTALAEQERSHEPLDIGSRLELFVDDYLIENMKGVRLKLHEPHSAGKVLTFDRPWEGNTSLYCTIFRDGDIYRLYYRGSSNPDYVVRPLLETDEGVVPSHPQVTCYAESRDGIHWERPSLGLYEFDGSRDNSIVWIGDGGHNFAPFKDGNPAAPDSERYKALGGGPLVAFKSADGIRWEKIREEPVITDGAFDSLNVPFWDSVRQLYVAIYRDFANGVRTIKCATSKDFIHWTSGEWADYGDAPREHLYTNATTPYFRAPHIYVAFPKRFLPWRHLLPVPEGDEGLSDGVFMTSRDGIHWDRRFLEAFIRPGRDRRNWIHRSNMVTVGVMATAKDEMSIYVARHYTFPSAHLERMVLRTDGFVSVHAGYLGGELVTRPLVFQGDNLVLNFATSAAGSIRLEIQDAQGNPLPGFALEEAPVIWGDEIERTVRWERSHAKATSDKPLTRLAGKPVRLRFVMKDADLYSLRFQ